MWLKKQNKTKPDYSVGRNSSVDKLHTVQAQRPRFNTQHHKITKSWSKKKKSKLSYFERMVGFLVLPIGRGNDSNFFRTISQVSSTKCL